MISDFAYFSFLTVIVLISVVMALVIYKIVANGQKQGILCTLIPALIVGVAVFFTPLAFLEALPGVAIAALVGFLTCYILRVRNTVDHN